MRRASVFLAVLLIGGAATAPAALGASSPFAGGWTTIDVVDGSTEFLAVGGGMRPRILWIDDYGTICVNAGASSTLFTATLSGSVDGSTLDGTFTSARCGSESVLESVGDVTFIYDADSDTLFDGVQTWTRI